MNSMKKPLTSFLLLLCLNYGQAGAQSGPGASNNPLKFPRTQWAQLTGPNCHGTTLAVTGLTGGLLIDWHWTLDLIMKSPFCTPVKKEQIQYGDIGAVRTIGGGQLGSDLAHSVTFLSSQEIFHKLSYSTESPFEKTKLKSLCRNYNIKGLCPAAPGETAHQFVLEAYRCRAIDYSSLERGQDLDASLRLAETLLEKLSLSTKTLSLQEHERLLESLRFLRQTGLKNRIQGRLEEKDSRVFFQRLFWRRLMNLKTQFHEVLRYPWKRAEISQALEDVLKTYEDVSP